MQYVYTVFGEDSYASYKKKNIPIKVQKKKAAIRAFPFRVLAKQTECSIET